MLSRRIARRALALGAVASVALVGTAVGAKLITGKQVKNESLTGKDVKDGSLGPAEFSGATAGATGPQGPPGLSASISASVNPEPDIDVHDFGVEVISEELTVGQEARVVATGALSFHRTRNYEGAGVSCQLQIDDVGAGDWIATGVESTDTNDVVSVTQGAVVQPGAHTVAVVCVRRFVAGQPYPVAFDMGHLTAVATAP